MCDAELIFCPLPLMRRRFFHGWHALAISACVLIGLILVAATSGVGFAFFILIMLALSGLFVPSGRAAAARLPVFSGIPSRAAALGRIVFELEAARPAISLLHEGAWSWAALEERLRQAGIPRPRAVVDTCLEPAVRGLDRPTHLLEPEPIVSSLPMSFAGMLFIVIVYGFFAVSHLVRGQVMQGMIFLVLPLLMLAQIPHVRERIPVLRNEEAPISGAGYVEHRRRRWTADDSTLLVSGRKPSGPLHVRLAGPAGWLSFSFMSPSDPDFVRLWQRWMHPRPRLELAG